MSTKLNMTRDVAGYNGFGLMFADDNFTGVLAANVEQTITVPSNYPSWLAVFSYTPGANIWININDTAAVPAGALAADGSELNPAGRLVAAGDVIHVISSDASSPFVNIMLYIVPVFGN